MTPFSIDTHADVVCCHLDLDVPRLVLGQCLDAAIDSPRFRRGMSFLDVRRRALTAAAIQNAAALIRSRARWIGPCRWAVVAGGEEDFPAVRMLALLTRGSGVTITPFTNLSRAEEWLRETVTAS